MAFTRPRIKRIHNPDILPKVPIPDGQETDGPSRDEDGNAKPGTCRSLPIKRGSRVYRPPYLHPRYGLVGSFRGRVVDVYADWRGLPVVRVQETGSGATRTTSPDRLRVQYGKVRAEKEGAAS